MQILICDPDQQRAKIWMSSILAEFKDYDIQIHITNRAENATAFISTLPTLDLIIAPTEMGGRPIASQIAEELRLLTKSLVLIAFGKGEISGKGIIYFRKEPLIGVILTEIKKKLEIEKPLLDLNYKSLPIDLIIKLKQVSIDLFIKIGGQKDDGGQGKFLKWLNGGEEIDLQKLGEFVKKGESQLWVTKNDFPKILEQLFVIFNHESEQGEKPGSVDKVVTQYLDFIGISDSHSTRVLNEQYETFKNPEAKYKTILAIIRDKKNEEDLRSVHGALTGVITSIFLEHFSWSLPEHSKLLNWASLLMDYEISDSEAILIRSQEEFDKLEKLRGEKYKIINHAKLASERFREGKNIPAELLDLIKVHHGVETGTGYDIQETAKLTSLQWLLVLSEEVSSFLIKNKSSIIDPKKLDEYILWKYRRTKLILNLWNELKSKFDWLKVPGA